jgi:lytic murein transglycosylase
MTNSRPGGIAAEVVVKVAALALSLFFALPATAALAAAKCGGPDNFPTWLAAFKEDAAAAGISKGAINAALSGVAYDPRVIALDRHQGHFKKDFASFSRTRITPGAIARGQSLMRAYAGVLARIEKRFGVQPPVLIAIWGLETGYGAGAGNAPALRSLATLASDCRRSDFFTGQLMDALRIVQRGDLTPDQMRGAWAGEMGQTQFLPSGYWKYAVDFDGDGKADLIHSVPDVLASTANYLKGYGWQAGQPWDEGTANFRVFAGWNKAPVYQKTIAVFATRLAGGNS